MAEASAHRPTTLRDYLAIARRRKWVILALPVIAATVAYVLSAMEAPVYQASAKVLVNRAAGFSTDITGTDPTIYDAARYLTTQANIARSPTLAARVATKSEVPGMTPGAVLGASSVLPDPDADVLGFSVSGGNAASVVKLVNAYAYEFTRYKTELDTARINDALRVVRSRMAALARQGQIGSTTYQTLVQSENQLLTTEKLVSNNTTVLEGAAYAGQLSPKPRRNLLAGGLLGLVIALGLALLAEALDRGVRTEDEIHAILDLPLLGRISAPPRKLQEGNGLVMLAEPMTARAEAFRKLRTSIEFVNRERRSRTLMFTSGTAGEGKSTTVANLAVAFARAGRKVALVDLDIRQPSLHSFIGARSEHGIADVVMRRIQLEHAIQQIALPAVSPSVVPANGNAPSSPAPSPSARWAPSGATAESGSNGRAAAQHHLAFLACGTIPSVESEFLGHERVSTTLESLSEAFEIILLDAPPFLAVGDAMALSANVDAIVVVTHLGTQRQILRDLVRELRQCRARTLGFVLTGVPGGEGHGYGYGYGYGYGSGRDAEADARVGGSERASVT